MYVCMYVCMHLNTSSPVTRRPSCMRDQKSIVLCKDLKGANCKACR